MEALTAAAVAALAAYDMIREEDPAAYVRSVRLLSTTDAEAAWHRPEDPVERPRPKVARGAGARLESSARGARAHLLTRGAATIPEAGAGWAPRPPCTHGREEVLLSRSPSSRGNR